jgi:hypothetical protein
MHAMLSIIFFCPSLALVSPSLASVHASLLSHRSVRSAFVNFDESLKIRETFCPKEVKKIWVAYHGLPDSYSEAVAVKTYPNSIRIPCVWLKSALQPVEINSANWVVLPQDNTCSLLQNYGMLNNHNLFIVN